MSTHSEFDEVTEHIMMKEYNIIFQPSTRKNHQIVQSMTVYSLKAQKLSNNKPSKDIMTSMNCVKNSGQQQDRYENGRLQGDVSQLNKSQEEG